MAPSSMNDRMTHSRDRKRKVKVNSYNNPSHLTAMFAMTMVPHLLFLGSLVLCYPGATAFQALPVAPRHASSTRLYIISGALKKYREEQSKKKMPLATREEAKVESPGLRVAASVWKWPSIWPYDKQFFMPPEDIPKPPAMNMNQMASMMSGIAQPTVPAVQVEPQEETKLDVWNYWGVEKANVKTEMDPEAIENLKK
jgi:hypothetical protein